MNTRTADTRTEPHAGPAGICAGNCAESADLAAAGPPPPAPLAAGAQLGLPGVTPACHIPRRAPPDTGLDLGKPGSRTGSEPTRGY